MKKGKSDLTFHVMWKSPRKSNFQTRNSKSLTPLAITRGTRATQLLLLAGDRFFRYREKLGTRDWGDINFVSHP